MTARKPARDKAVPSQASKFATRPAQRRDEIRNEAVQRTLQQLTQVQWADGRPYTVPGDIDAAVLTIRRATWAAARVDPPLMEAHADAQLGWSFFDRLAFADAVARHMDKDYR